MDIQIVQDDVPLRRFGVACHQALEMCEGILFRPCWPPGWFDDLAAHHIPVDEPGQCAVANVFEFASQHMTGKHWQVGIVPFQRLDPCQLIQADGALSLFGAFHGTQIEGTSLTDLLVPVGIRYFREPVPESVGLEAPFLSSRDACRGEIWVTMPRAFISSAISLPVH